MRRYEQGNALFLILIAVALFAALSYAVTQSGRGSGTVNKEQAMIMAAQITQEAASIQVAVTRMILTGTPKDSIEYMPTTFQNLCTAGVNCLFSPEGGGAKFPSPPSGAFTQDITGTTNSRALVCAPNNFGPGLCLWVAQAKAVDGIGTAAADPFIHYLFLTEEVCRAINKGLGISGIPIEADIVDALLDAAPGKAAACIDSGNAGYDYYHVLVEN